MREWIQRFYQKSTGRVALVCGILALIPEIVALFGSKNSLSALIALLLLGLIWWLPIFLTLMNLYYCLYPGRDPQIILNGKRIEGTTIVAGTLLSIFYGMIVSGTVFWFKRWNEQLYNNELHSPLSVDSATTIFLLSLVAVIGYLFLRFREFSFLSPLKIVLGISCMYLGMSLCIVWLIQISSSVHTILWPLTAFPLNCILIAIKVIKELSFQWNEAHSSQEELQKYENRPFLKKLNGLLSRSCHWPWLAFLLMLPLLGILIGILALLGQAPDNVVKAWTETSDWNLFQQTAPQNLFRDEHYLCTVAAGGHKKVVKPLRLGERQGHKVIVNRQLCIANAFEQILEEKTPRFHRWVRHTYDTYGYPFAKHIHREWEADLIYLLMKPAEWFFLAVIYFCDTKPENRIAVQYLPKRSREDR